MVQLQSDIERLGRDLKSEQEARRELACEEGKLRDQLEVQKEVMAGLHSHNVALVQEVRTLREQLELAHNAHRATRGEVSSLHQRWQLAAQEVSEWQERFKQEQVHHHSQA